ncbi:hypothetical protein EG339_23010 [Chryseobacterium bernardetii]|uniref:Uncharacterized protein n=1 Tax=Chryseobacterium bernardetii TaxID=1241978 RepID=A0A3G6TDH4_9FLAO|nr:hypothetical protein [Chryseobacterium bernardetii]AZB27252.1 hypothetical protein EG339_23010 [Chryseobacterium bernardetii]
MKNLLPLIIICFFSCENKTNKQDCIIDFEISKNTVNSKGIISDLKFQKNVLKISISNLRNDTLHFPAPRLFFVKEIIKQNIEESNNVVTKQFIPNIITDRVTAYCITEDNKKQIVSIDSSKTRDMQQYGFKLAPKAKYIVEYLLNCKASDPEKYKIVFFESSRFNDSKYEKIKYPENGYIEIKK